MNNPFLFVFYHFSRLLVRIIFHTYYSKTTYRNKEILSNLKGPAIILSNHPSTLMDPFNVAKETKQMVFFLANASLLRSPGLGWFLGSTFGIPIERPQDVQGEKIDNENAFRYVDDFLTKGGCLYIAPEGGSKVERRLRKVKTGTARIGFSAEKSNDFKLGLQLIPVGVTYSDPLKFRSKAFINVGQPIIVADFKEEWEKDDREAVRILTRHIQDTMRGLLLHTDEEDEDIDTLIRQSEQLIDPDARLTMSQQFDASQQLAQKLLYLKNNSRSAFESLKNTANQFFDLLKKWKLTTQSIHSKNTFWDYITIITGLPFFIYGFINNLLPSIIPTVLAKKLPLYKGYIPTIYCVIGGLFTFPIFYWLQTKYMGSFFQNTTYKWIYLVSLFPTGLFAWWYMQHVKSVNRKNRFATLQKKEPTTMDNLLEQQRTLLNESTLIS